ncbi:MFS transporter [Ruegeria arenilitoris]|uniref:MFS transporter n=1 Tax=Ruegeria arenilitoris TaxID=1173585 RepID=UPI00147D4AD6|nr:MFS transporter [Ruegeria arenilitoris]
MKVSKETSDMRGARVVLAMTAICMMVVGFNTTAVATILPNLKAEFDLGPSGLQWVMAVYTVVSATLVTIVSRLGDITGKMGVFFFGMIVFAVGSGLVLFSQDAAMLLIGRGAQGAGAAALFGTSLSLLTAATPEEKRASVTGAWGAIVGLAIGLGPIVGGAFAHYISWRGVFATDLVLLVAAFIIGLRVQRQNYVPDTRLQGAKFDFPSAVALVLLLGPLSFALSNGESKGWGTVTTLIPLCVSVVAVFALITTSRRSDDPLIELRYFRHPRYLMAATGMFFTGFALFCFFVYFNTFVQSPDTFAYTAIGAGAAILPLSLSMFAVSVTAPRFLAPYSFQWPIILGMGSMACGLFLLTSTTNTTGYSEIWWKLVILGLGLGIGFSLLPRLGLRLLPEEHVGQGSGVVNAFLYFGATLGAVIGGLAEARSTRSGLAEVIAALPAGSNKEEELSRALTHGTPSQIQQIISGMNPNSGTSLAKALRDLQDNAFDSAMLCAAVAASIAVILALLLLRGPVPPLQDAKQLVKDKS